MGWTIHIGQWPYFTIEPFAGEDIPVTGVFPTKLAAAEHMEASLREAKWAVAKQIARASAIRRREERKVRP